MCGCILWTVPVLSCLSSYHFSSLSKLQWQSGCSIHSSHTVARQSILNRKSDHVTAMPKVIEWLPIALKIKFKFLCMGYEPCEVWALWTGLATLNNFPSIFYALVVLNSFQLFIYTRLSTSRPSHMLCPAWHPLPFPL